MNKIRLINAIIAVITLLSWFAFLIFPNLITKLFVGFGLGYSCGAVIGEWKFGEKI